MVRGLQTTQPISGGAVTALTNLYENYVEPSRPQQWEHKLGKSTMRTRWMAGTASQKRVMSRLIQVRQLQMNKSGFAISAINKYMLGSRYPSGATGLKLGAPQMRRYPPSTIHRYVDLPSTQIIQTHTDITPSQPLQTLVQAPSPPTLQPKHRHTSNPSPVPTGLVKPKPNPLIHSPCRPSQNTYTFYTLHQLLIPHTTLINNTSVALDTIPEPRVRHALHSPQPHLFHPPQKRCRQPRTITLS